MRPKRKILHMATAYLWSKRALCKQPNRTIGCLITTEDMKQILSFGYNGPPQPLGNEACKNVQGGCGCLHAEINALIKVDDTIPNKILFVTMSPCEDCAAAIAQADISKVYYGIPYRNTKGLDLLAKCHIHTEQLLLTANDLRLLGF